MDIRDVTNCAAENTGAKVCAGIELNALGWWVPACRLGSSHAGECIGLLVGMEGFVVVGWLGEYFALILELCKNLDVRKGEGTVDDAK